MRKFRHLTYTDRLRIELYLREGKKTKEIARLLGVHVSTINRERKRGQYEHLNSDYTTEPRYSPEIANERYERNKQAKGAPLKIGSDHELARFIEDKIVKEKYSPAAVVGEIKTQGLCFSTTICEKTIYNYIDKGVFLTLTNKDLPVKGTRKRKYRKVRQSRAPRGESIEQRPEIIESRTTFGQWEMDTVIGRKKSKETLLVLTERLTRYEIIIGMPDRTAASVVRALDTLEKEYGKRFMAVFQSITVDNGVEFSDCAGIEKSRTGKGARTKVYYCHAYSSWERGSNENANKLIRRHIPKGADLRQVKRATSKQIETWINNYPREILGFQTSAMLFERCLCEIA